MIPEEEVKKIKEQIIQQIDSWHASEEQKEQAKKQILVMPPEALEDFLTKNKLIKPASEEKPAVTETNPTQCPFCLIIEGKLQAYKIDENKAGIAVLEINPLSKGHTIVIPKKHLTIEKVSSQAFSLAKKLAKKIKNKFKSKEVNIQSADAFGHGIINIIPLYENKKLERKKAEENELKELQEKLISKLKVKKQAARKKEEKQSEQLEKAPRRVP